MNLRISLRLFPFLLGLTPALAFASGQTDLISQIAGLFYIVVGLGLVASFLLMGTRILLWIIRLGTEHNHRDQAIHIMEWSVATLFTVILILGVVEFVQTHTSATLYLLSVGIILRLAWLVITAGVFSGGADEKKEEH